MSGVDICHVKAYPTRTSTYSITKWALTLILNMTLQDASTAAKLKADYEVAFYRKG